MSGLGRYQKPVLLLNPRLRRAMLRVARRCVFRLHRAHRADHLVRLGQKIRPTVAASEKNAAGNLLVNNAQDYANSEVWRKSIARRQLMEERNQVQPAVEERNGVFSYLTKSVMNKMKKVSP